MTFSFVSRNFSLIFFLFFLHTFLFANGQQTPGNGQQTPETEAAFSQDSGRIINDILEIFAPSNDAPSPNQDEPSLPFGFNKILARSPPQNAVSLVEASRRSPLGPAPSFRSSAPRGVVATPWADLAKEVIDLFRSEVVSTTPKPTTSASLVQNWLNPFLPLSTPAPALLPFTLPTLSPSNPLLPFLSPATSTPKPSSIFSHLTAIFDKNEPEKVEPEIDTGGRNFDRLVIREKDTGGDLLSTLVGGKWKERGLQWKDGNLRLVNKKGSNLLGSELSVHDRSVDIPVQRWFDMANNLVNAYQNPVE